MDDTLSSEEDGAINAGYAVWRELIAELIASEKDDNCAVVSRFDDKKDLLQLLHEGELLKPAIGKMGCQHASLRGTDQCVRAKRL